MNASDFDMVVKNRMSACEHILCEKAKEYAPGVDRVSNFKQAAAFQSVSPEQALFGMVAKHMVALGDFCREVTAGSKPRSYEQWDEKIGDIINYMILLDALVIERIREYEKASFLG